MDGRFPYDPPGGQQRLQQQAQLQAAIEIEEALYLQRQREIQRDLQLRQMILQDQIDQQLMQSQQQQRLLESYGLPSQSSLQQIQEDQLLMQHQEQLRRQQLQQEIQLAHALGNQSRNRDALVAEALAAEQAATRRPDLQTSNNIQAAKAQSNAQVQAKAHAHAQTAQAQAQAQAQLQQQLQKESQGEQQRKRQLEVEDMEEAEVVKPPPPARKNSKRQEKQQKARSNSIEDSEAAPTRPPPKKKARGKTQSKKAALKNALKKEEKEKKKKQPAKRKTPPIDIDADDDDNESKEEIAMAAALLDGVRKDANKLSVDALAKAAEDEQKADDAAKAMFALRENVDWSESEDEEEKPAESITVGDFHSQVPRLPVEPEFNFSRLKAAAARRKAIEEKTREESVAKTPPSKSKKSSKHDEKEATPGGHKAQTAATDYPFPVDTWWPANAAIRRERRSRSEKSDEEDCADEPTLKTEDGVGLFSGSMTTIKNRMANDVEPGVLEKLPHCKIHKLRAKQVKGGPKLEPMFCFQVTETTCNDIMVCCSVCSTWRHSFCGGHYEPYSVRTSLESETPFKAICDRCHEEEKYLEDCPKAQTRIERQRAEQCRRALGTSSVIRQASFAKHGGTYKWPLGSVSATHIGGHTRSVHSRHDKAEKQWSEMSVRLDRGGGYRPKERVKVRTRELERLLVSVEDAEGVMDRHNMILFLQNDTGKEDPFGFDRSKRNLFDPEDDQLEDLPPVDIKIDVGLSEEEEKPYKSFEEQKREEIAAYKNGIHVKDHGTEHKNLATNGGSKECARGGCSGKPRFDSVFCSDSCGVSALETDLLRALQNAGDIHPSLLRT